jgi:outer membrane protein assembly factor BamB
MMRRIGLFLAGVAIASCGGGQTNPRLFSADWLDDGGKSIEEVRMRLGGARASAGTDIVVAVAGNSDKLVGQPMNGARWTFAHTLDARPVVAGAIVLGSGGNEIFALEASTGRKLWARPTGGLPLYGAGDDGTVTVVTLAQPGERGSELLAVTHDGVVVRQAETDKMLGAPAVLGKIAFVPWGNQYVSAIDLATGDEIGRVVMREKVSRAWTSGGAMYFGEVGIFRFDQRIREASKNGASHVGLPERELPGQPRLLTPGGEKQSPAANAQDKIRLYARPTDNEAPLAIQDGRFYATYFRLAMGLDAQKGRIAWVHTHKHDLIGGEAISGGVVLCDEQGKVTTLDAKTGGVAGEIDLGEPVKSCVVGMDRYRLPESPRGAAPRSGAPGTLAFRELGPDTPGLAQQISEAVLAHDPQLATVYRLLLRELTTLPDELATRTLVELASDSRTSPAIVGDARAGLASRRNGAKYMLEALERHYDFLKDVLRPPPVGPIAQALAEMKENRAAALLASHLLDPADTPDDVKHAAAALVALGGPGELPTIKQFFAMYRGAAESDEVALAAVSAGEALLRLGGKDGRSAVDFALKDPMTEDMVRTRLDAVVKALDEAKSAK